MEQIQQKTISSNHNKVLFNIKQASQSMGRPVVNPNLSAYQIGQAAFDFDRKKSFTIASSSQGRGGHVSNRNMLESATLDSRKLVGRNHQKHAASLPTHRSVDNWSKVKSVGPKYKLRKT